MDSEGAIESVLARSYAIGIGCNMEHMEHLTRKVLGTVGCNIVARDTASPFSDHDTIHHAEGRVHQTTVGTIGQGRQIMRPTTASPTSVLF